MSRTEQAAAGDGSVIFTVVDGTARLVLNRPTHLNALNQQCATSFYSAVRNISERTDVGLVIISGVGAGFCAGGDVVEMHRASDRGDYLRELVGEMHAAIALLAELPIVVVTLVHGVVAGGGLGVMLSGDIVVAEEGTRFVAAYNKIGLTPDCGLTTLLPATIGCRRADDFMLNSRTILADQALAWGMITEVVGPGALARRATELAEGILNGSPAALGRARLLSRRAGQPDFRSRLADEAVAIEAMARSARAGELIERFASRMAIGT